MYELTNVEIDTVEGGWVKGVIIGVVANAVYDAGKWYFDKASNMDMEAFGRFEAGRTGNKMI